MQLRESILMGLEIVRGWYNVNEEEKFLAELVDGILSFICALGSRKRKERERGNNYYYY
jgi:hypothetical protein